MSEINVNLVLASDFESFGDASLLEKNYQNVFKPLISFLYSHPGLFLTVAFTGAQLSFYIKKHPESIELLHELLLRKQIEVLGGGYYAPLFPFLFPADRNAQIEKMTSLLRSSLGKRPYGACLYASAWENSLVTTFQSCGLDFVFLDSSLVKKEFDAGFPLIASEHGKNLKVLLASKKFNPKADEEFSAWIKRLGNFYKDDESRQQKSINVMLSFDEVGSLFKSESSAEYFSLPEKKGVSFTLPSLYLKKCSSFTPCCIHGGLEKKVSEWSDSAYEKIPSSQNHSTVYDYLNLYPQNKNLLNRMIYIAMLISQCKGDKVRKNFAGEKLHESQWGGNFISSSGLPSVAERRQQSYRALNEAEKLAREAMKIFKESMTSFDYDGDGLNEYVCQMEKYNAVVSLKGGCISDLNVLKGCANYGANLQRMKKFDGAEDSYTRGIFVEHLFSESEFENKAALPSSKIFSSTRFSEKKIDVKRKEIQLEAKENFSDENIPVGVRKKFTFLSSGIAVQYILKNEGEKNLSAYFVSELNFSQTRFDKDFSGGRQFSSEVIADGNREELAFSDFVNKDSGISFLQIKDSADKKIFVIEPNEESGLCCSLIKFSRPVSDGEVKNVSSTYSVRLYWKIDLAPGMEKEKTINLSVVQVKKN